MIGRLGDVTAGGFDVGVGVEVGVGVDTSEGVGVNRRSGL